MGWTYVNNSSQFAYLLWKQRRERCEIIVFLSQAQISSLLQHRSFSCTLQYIFHKDAFCYYFSASVNLKHKQERERLEQKGEKERERR